MTVLGIALSMSLFTAVILGAQSGIEFVRNVEIAESGRFHAYFFDIDDAQIAQAKANPEIADTATWQEVGWVDIETDRPNKNKLLIQSIDDRFPNLVAVRLDSGRMPEKDDEIIIPAHVEPYMENMYHVGDVVTFEIKERIEDGKRLGFAIDDERANEKENFRTIETKSYTIVGIYNRISSYIEEYNTPGYIALTKGGGNGGKALFFTVKNPGNFDQFIQSLEISAAYKQHGNLLKMYGSFGSNPLGQFMYTFATILIIIISFGSITLIYNSFSISIGERTKQFGILKSIGATKKQIRRSVLFEALSLSIISIPIGMAVGIVGIGTTLWALKDAFASVANIAINNAADAVSIKLVISPFGLIIASLVCLVTTLVSAYIPAFRAMRMQPVEAIRQIKDIKIKAKKVKVSPITKALFGFEGMMASKNFKRNKKNYRAAVVSLFLSITLFVSATYLTHSLRSGLDVITSNEVTTDILLSLEDQKNPIYRHGSVLPEDFDEKEFSEEISKAEYTTRFSSIVSVKTEIQVLPEYCTEEFRKDRIDSGEDQRLFQHIDLYFVGDDEFKEICKLNHIDPDEFYDEDAPKSIVYNYYNSYREDKKIAKTQFLKESALPVTLPIVAYRKIDGYWPWRFHPNDVEYYRLEYLKEYMDSEDRKLDREKALIVPRREAMLTNNIVISRAIEELPRTFFRGDHIIFYPRKMLDIIVPQEMRAGMDFSYQYHFSSDNPAKTHIALKKMLIDRKMSANQIYNMAENRNTILMVIDIINVFALGFVIIISFITAANVFNTISTNILLRRREFANLKSIGLGKRSFQKMMVYECIIYGIKGVLWGVPSSILVTYWIHHNSSNSMIYVPYSPPTMQIGIAVLSVLLVVFASMIYAVKKIEKDNVIEALRNENL